MHLSRHNCFCVYQHVDPRTGDIRYIGIGAPSRAYNTSRSEEHEEWLEDLLEEGYSLWDVVQITRKDLNKEDALLIESSLIRQKEEGGAELFNVHHTKKRVKPEVKRKPKETQRPKDRRRQRKFLP